MKKLSRFARAALAPLAAAVLLVPGAAAQTVTGSLVDDADGAPISGAVVLLLDQGAAEITRDTTDAGGTFRLAAGDAGLFMVVVKREGFADHLSDAFAVADGEDYPLDLTLRGQRVGESGAARTDTLSDQQLLAMAISQACEGTYRPGLHGILFGAVRDEATGEPIPGASLRLEWREVAARDVAPSRTTVQSDEVGAYLVCDAPAGREIEVLPSVSGVDGDERTLQVNAGTMRAVDFGIPLSNPDLPGNLLGFVTDQQTGSPLAGASVRLKELGRTAVTNSRGVFTLADLPSGVDSLEVELIGYATQKARVQIVGGRAQSVDVRMSTQPVELAPILVSVEPRSWFSDRAGLEDRIDRGNGIIITRREIDERQPTNLGDMMRGLPGVRVFGSGGGITATYTVQLRNAMRMNGAICQPMVWVDGSKWGQNGSAFTDISGFELEAVEIYRGPAEVPGEFSGGDANCGVVVVWTRRGIG